ncbi:serine/threonine-protein kinase ATR isoform X2 [Cucumis melo var. makuwa]|uniref:Serine/threonine-protein kinase ATR isoform X2 n=1 Tax=Cucumis melo var. makuwa TaxID=1194695 RepID=A0A5D3DJI1_CUCMM|nr:serine/threonine-protein kinase ATR isoform X2 [Cucumis melo var. makuwa]TYK23389.1 serine/threonine-protein kinase ATR isoform X2 [Cucumis melo var. makuwa]
MLPFYRQNMIDGLGITGYEGIFLRVCEITLSVLRSHRDTLMSILETFIHDPLVEWTKSHKSSGVEVQNPHAQLAISNIEARLRGVVVGVGAAPSLPLAVEDKMRNPKKFRGSFPFTKIKGRLFQHSSPVALASSAINLKKFLGGQILRKVFVLSLHGQHSPLQFSVFVGTLELSCGSQNLYLRLFSPNLDRASQGDAGVTIATFQTQDGRLCGPCSNSVNKSAVYHPKVTDKLVDKLILKFLSSAKLLTHDDEAIQEKRKDLSIKSKAKRD